MDDKMKERLLRMQGMLGNDAEEEAPDIEEDVGNVNQQAEESASNDSSNNVVNTQISNPTQSPTNNPTGLKKLVQGEKYEDSSNKAVDGNPNIETRTAKDGKKLPMKIVAIVLCVVALSAAGIFGAWKAGLLEPAEKPKDIDELLETQNTSELEIENVAFSYTDDEKSMLRARGYTAEDIEEGERLETDAKELIDKADQERKEYLDKTMKPLFDTASPEYKRNAATTWLGLKDNMDGIKKIKKSIPYTEYEAIKNFDYERIPIRGHQPFIKIYIDGTKHKDWIFMSVSPQRYNELKARGNIIVRFNYIVETKIKKDGTVKENKKNFFITKIEEYESGETEMDSFDEANPKDNVDDSYEVPDSNEEVEIEGID